MTTISNQMMSAMSVKQEKEIIGSAVKFLKRQLIIGMDKDKRTVDFVLSTYDLTSFIGTYNGNNLDLLIHFASHVDAVQKAVENF